MLVSYSKETGQSCWLQWTMEPSLNLTKGKALFVTSLSEISLTDQFQRSITRLSNY